MDDLGRNQPGPWAENDYYAYIEVKPWPRFMARVLDSLFFSVLIFTSADKLLRIEMSFLNTLLLYMAALFAWCFFEAFLLAVIGTTPGKWLLNIRIRERSGGKPTFPKALKRSLLVWLCGMWMGAPILAIPALVFSYCRLVTEKNTAWDKKSGCTVDHAYMQVIKAVAVFILFSCSFYLLILKPSVDYIIKNGFTYNTYNAVSSSRMSLTGNEASEFNRQGLDMIDAGNYEAARTILKLGLEKDPPDFIKDSLYCNLSIACYNLGDYAAALDFAEKGFKISGSSFEEYLNYGNVLKSLGRTEEAQDAYNKSLELERDNPYSKYGLGVIKYEKGEYSEATVYFKEYTRQKKDDPVGWSYLGLCYLYGDKDMSRARENLEKALEKDPADETAISSMGEYYSYINDTGKTEKLYIDALAKKPGDYGLLCSAAEYYSNQKDYGKAVEYSDRAIDIDKSRYEAYKAKAQAYLWDGQKDKAVETTESMAANSPENVMALNAAGDMFSQAYEYKLAGGYYDRALSLEPSNITACVGKIGSMYYRKRYTQCLKFALESEKQFDSTDILWYIADTYSTLRDSEKALEYYKKALDTDTDNMNLNISLGWEYYNSEDFSNAGLYADKALEFDASDQNAKYLKESIAKRQRSLPEQASEFIQNNYMYYKTNTDYEKLKNRLKEKGAASGEELTSLFETVHLKDDIFSYVLYGDNYRRYLEYEAENSVEYRLLGPDIHYIRIMNFTETTSNEFVDVIDSIEDPQDQYLVIDLRGNGGGYTESGCNILDFLLSDCVVCNLIYKDGYSDSYYSDEECIRFLRIFVFVDENTASCSELVTLGLKTYLDNVTVIGRKTFGKGVGQTAFIDDTNELALFSVNHFWNVRETNIMGKGIQPDITVEGDSIDTFKTEVLKRIGL